MTAEQQTTAFLKCQDAIERLENENMAMRDAIKEALAVLLELEYEGNEKGTRCISCGSHCCEPHADDCVMHQAISKTKPFLTEPKQHEQTKH